MASVSKREWTTKEGHKKSAWTVRYFDRNTKGKNGKLGRHCSEAFELKRDADAFRRKVESEIENGTHIAQCEKVTVREMCERFLRAQEIRVADKRIGASALRNLRTAIDNDVIPALGGKFVADLTADDSVELYSRMIRRKLAVVTARSRMISWGMVLKYATRQGALKRDFREEVRDELRGAELEKAPTFTQEQVGKLLAVLPQTFRYQKPRPHVFLRCAIYLAAFCGLRAGEVRGLRIKDIDFEARIIRVRRSITNLNEVKGPKTQAGVRDIPAPPIVLDSLREWIDNYYVESDEGFVFRSIHGAVMGKSNFHSNLWWPLLKRAGLYNSEDIYHFHSLRHFYGSWLIDQGVPLPQVASLMGHASISTTLKTYAHQLNGGRREHSLVDAFATRMLPRPAPTIDHVAP